jgi:hypothetical protein
VALDTDIQGCLSKPRLSSSSRRENISVQVMRLFWNVEYGRAIIPRIVQPEVQNVAD